MRDDRIAALAGVLYMLFLPGYPLAVGLMDKLTGDAVIAIATAVNVAVTAVYALFTWGLWRETRTSGRIAADQAQTARQIFEAGHRPYLEIVSEHHPIDRGDGRPKDHEFRFELRNHGSVPAVVTRWELTLLHRGVASETVYDELQTMPPVIGMAVFPESTTYTIPDLTKTVAQEPGPDGPLVTATVHYSGVGDRSYVTRLRMRVMFGADGVPRYFLVDTMIDVAVYLH